MQEKITDLVPGKYTPGRKRVLVQISGNIFYVDRLT